MEITIKSISYGIMWTMIGIATAMLFMRLMKSSIRTLTPGKDGISALLIAGGAMLRWLTMAVLLYLAIRMSVAYALILVAAFSITRFVMVIRLSKESRQAKNQQGDE